MKEPAHQPHAIAGIAIQWLHGLARLGAGAHGVLVTGQPVSQIAQQEHRITGLQPHRLGLAIDV
ncbi:hypothetical protein D3C80_2203300 [compost metagenome]